MKLINLFVILFFSIKLCAQKTQANKVLIGYNFSSDYNYRTLKNNDNTPMADVIIKSRNQFEIAKFGYTTGVDLLFNCSKNWGLETGLQYSNNGYKTENQELSFGSPDETLPIKAQFIYSYQYVGIPLKAKYIFGKNNLHFISSVGFMTNFLVNEKAKIKYEYKNGREETKTESNNSDINKINILPVISVGVDYKLCKKMHLVVEPTYRYSLLKLKNAPISENLWNMGLNVGLYYEIK